MRYDPAARLVGDLCNGSGESARKGTLLAAYPASRLVLEAVEAICPPTAPGASPLLTALPFLRTYHKRVAKRECLEVAGLACTALSHQDSRMYDTPELLDPT